MAHMTNLPKCSVCGNWHPYPDSLCPNKDVPLHPEQISSLAYLASILILEHGYETQWRAITEAAKRMNLSDRLGTASQGRGFQQVIGALDELLRR
jgi:hypothetical protein